MVAARASTSRRTRPSPLSRQNSHDDDEQDANGKGKAKEEEEDDDDDDDDDDASGSDGEAIIRRIPVYFNPRAVDHLALLQYPDRPQKRWTSHPLVPPSLRPNADDPHRAPEDQVQARYKPSSQHLEISIPIERHHPQRWNDDQARLFASGVVTEADTAKETQARLDAALGKKGGRRARKNPHVDDEEQRREREQREKRRLERLNYKSIALPELTHYFAMVVRDDSVHLAPVTQTFQLRPNLQYLDQIITNERRRKREEKASADADADSDGDISDAELKKEEAKAVQVSVKQEAEGASALGSGGMGNRGPANGRAGASLFTPLRQEENEEWRKAKHFHADTSRANDAYDMIVNSQDDSYEDDFNGTLKPRDYLQG